MSGHVALHEFVSVTKFVLALGSRVAPLHAQIIAVATSEWPDWLHAEVPEYSRRAR
jgi:hypothetical protein